jgi:bifunctional non-homologous end joining protein LigD
VRQTDLFPEFDAGLGRERGSGCAKPIGKRTRPRRRVHRARARRPSTVAILSEVRSLLQDGLGDIAASLRRVERGAWKISRVAPICPRAMALPRIQPIAPTWRKDPFDHLDWLFDTKYDGFRAVCYVENGRCGFVSRRGNVFTRFDALCEQVASALCHDVVSELGVDEAILDGEVITADETGRPQFYDLLRRTRSPIYVAFDLLWLNGDDLRSLPLRERREQLKTILPPGSPSILEAVSVERRGRELFELMCAHDLEGIVAKRLADPYDPRVRWLKIKNPDYSQKEGRADRFNAPPRRRNFG